MMICLIAVVAVQKNDTETENTYRAFLHGGHVVPISEVQYIACTDYLAKKNEQELNHVMGDYEGLDDLIAKAGGTD